MARATVKRTARAKGRARAKTRRAPAAVKPRRPLAIDWHTHIFLPEVVEFNRDHLVVNNFRPPTPEQMNRTGFTRGGMSWDPDPKARLKKMDEMRVDIQVLSASLVHQCTYWAPAHDALRMDKMSNDAIAEMCSYAPHRFVGIASVPLQAPDLAARELDRAVNQIGLRGANIASYVNDEEIGEARFWPFWAKAEELDVPVYIHPAGIRGERFQKYLLWNSVGQTIEETMAMFSLIHEGVMDAFPNLKVVMAHGGGFLPYYAGRVDRNTEAERRPRLGAKLTEVVSAYFKRFWYDTCMYDPFTLRSLAARVGPSRLVMGSDYPVGDLDPVGFVWKERALSETAKVGILGKNAARLLKIG